MRAAFSLFDLTIFVELYNFPAIFSWGFFFFFFFMQECFITIMMAHVANKRSICPWCGWKARTHTLMKS
jgi:hypothetical protein